MSLQYPDHLDAAHCSVDWAMHFECGNTYCNLEYVNHFVSYGINLPPCLRSREARIVPQLYEVVDDFVVPYPHPVRDMPASFWTCRGCGSNECDWSAISHITAITTLPPGANFHTHMSVVQIRQFLEKYPPNTILSNLWARVPEGADQDYEVFIDDGDDVDDGLSLAVDVDDDDVGDILMVSTGDASIAASSEPPLKHRRIRGKQSLRQDMA